MNHKNYKETADTKLEKYNRKLFEIFEEIAKIDPALLIRK